MTDVPEPSGAVVRATKYVREHATSPDGVTLRRWRGDWYQWTSERGCYAQASDEVIDRELYRKLGLGDRREVGDARAALIAVGDVPAERVPIDDVELCGWIGEPALDANALDVAACSNGLLHLPTGGLMPATPRYFATSTLGVAYDDAAPEPTKWLTFLRALWPHDDESIEALQDWIGYLLTPDTRQQKILLLVGPRRSGKGTIMRVVAKLLGRDSVAAPTLASLANNFGLQPLIGRTAAIVGDARLGGRSDIAQIVERLLSISGQDSITVDRKHREPWTGYLSTRISLVTNELPRFSDSSGAVAGRMLVLELAQSWYEKEDTGLTDALLTELPGILSWAIQGWRRLRDRGRFVQPASSAGTVEEMADLASPVAAWVRERCVVGAGHAVLCTSAYGDYRAWCVTSGIPTPTTTTFGRDLRAATGCQRKQVRDGAGKQPWHYIGVELAPVTVSPGVTG